MVTGQPTSIATLLAAGERSFSFEFFPPKDAAGEEVLWRSLGELESLKPTFVSVTYGAGGSTRDRTIEITGRIARETTMTPMAHLTCVGHTVDELGDILDSLSAAGVRNVLALRGDPPGGPGTEWIRTDGGVDYAADLVSLVRARDEFSIGVAVFPEGHRDSTSLDADVAVMKAKHDAGAEFGVTEMVLRASDYFGLVERCRAAGVDMPIIPGIMPILAIGSMKKMVELSGREMPDEVLARIEPLAEDPEAVRAEGIRIATELCDDLLAGGAPGLHFYTLNRSKATREIYAALAVNA
ncbi:methylenetetrahydrofolate reductase [NAD(P)H] [Nocardioides marmoriginsengisoli]|uniref:Methylenetetrahydrofolate reductase n=1 Tax=Nocardioides marmoriginsengisoli TaxID=661483 RepID=A0A3N0CNX1_9ACTN|nr:methylenetetrahydrofolate reductase [NAD(P)H] [Nocardioides marmoriginsengisoli]RNL65019.1 methylenetetrahydrofolate reductase [NAD(P)H] [Nocardioides marmoriginsengisoli]